MLRGILPILQTPFGDDGELDLTALDAEIEFCIECGVDGLVVPANASEFFVLDDAERFEITRHVLQTVRNRVPVVISVSAISQRSALRFAEHARSHGAAALMSMPAYVRKPTEPAIRHYFESLAHFGLPLIIQNAPPPLGTPMGAEHLLRLMEQLPSPSYIKEELPPSTHRVSGLLGGRATSHFGVFGGADGRTMLSELSRGASGFMPAASIPDVHVAIFQAFQAGEHDLARSIYKQLGPFFIYGQLYGVTWAKEVLRRRGVFRNASTRDPQAVPLDHYDHVHLDEYWPTLLKLIRISRRYPDQGVEGTDKEVGQ